MKWPANIAEYNPARLPSRTCTNDELTKWYLALPDKEFMAVPKWVLDRLSVFVRRIRQGV